MKKRYPRIAAALLLLALLFSLGGCSASRTVRASSTARKVVATAGNMEIAYEELYYVTMTRIAEMKAAHGANYFEEPAHREELKVFVSENLITRYHALISVAKDYGISLTRGEIADSVQDYMDVVLEDNFGGDRDAYIESLNKEYLTDNYVRTFFAVEDYLATAIVKAMLEKGDLDSSDTNAMNLIMSDAMIRTIQVFIDKSNTLYTEAEHKAHAEEIAATLAAAATDSQRYDRMREAIGGRYNTDFGDTLGNGYYFVRGEMDAAYEEAAFSLAEYGASGVIETDEGFYVIMRLPKDTAYINKNFEALKEKTYFVALNNKVNARMAELVPTMTDYGSSLDLLNLPTIDAAGGEGIFLVLWGALGALALLGVAWTVRYLIFRHKGAKAKK